MADTPLKLRKDAVQWRSIEGEIVAIDVGHFEYLGVNKCEIGT